MKNYNFRKFISQCDFIISRHILRFLTLSKNSNIKKIIENQDRIFEFLIITFYQNFIENGYVTQKTWVTKLGKKQWRYNILTIDTFLGFYNIL